MRREQQSHAICCRLRSLDAVEWLEIAYLMIPDEPGHSSRLEHSEPGQNRGSSTSLLPRPSNIKSLDTTASNDTTWGRGLSSEIVFQSGPQPLESFGNIRQYRGRLGLHGLEIAYLICVFCVIGAVILLICIGVGIVLAAKSNQDESQACFCSLDPPNPSSVTDGIA